MAINLYILVLAKFMEILIKKIYLQVKTIMVTLILLVQEHATMKGKELVKHFVIFLKIILRQKLR